MMRMIQTYAKYHESLVSASALLIDNSLDDLENKFAPVPPPKDDSWLNILLGFVSMGTPMIGGKFFSDGELLDPVAPLFAQTAEPRLQLLPSSPRWLPRPLRLSKRARRRSTPFFPVES